MKHNLHILHTFSILINSTQSRLPIYFLGKYSGYVTFKIFNTNRKKQYCFLLLLIIFSCERENDEINYGVNNELFIKIVSGNKQIGYSFQELDDDIVITIKGKDSIPYKDANFKYLVNPGNGLVCERYGSIKGEYRFRWLLNCNEGTQNFSILAFDSLNRFIDTLKLTSTSKFADKWNRSCGLAVDSCNFSFEQTETIFKHPIHGLFLLTGSVRKLYNSTDQGASWSKIFTFDFIEFGFPIIDISHEGKLYIYSDKGLLTSVDGKSWTKLFEHAVSSLYIYDNGRLILNSQGRGRFLSNDYGQTWIMDNTLPTYTKIVRIEDNIFCAKHGVDHANLLISKDNGVNWESINTSGFYDIVDIAYNNNYLYLVHLSGSQSVPVIYKSVIDQWSWNYLATLIKAPSNYPSIAKIKFYQNKIYALTDIYIYEINSSGDTTAITRDIINKFPVIKTYEISSEGNIIIGSSFGGYDNKGVFYKKLDVP